MKRLSRVSLGIVALIAGLVIAGVLLADALVRQGVERAGTAATGTEVALTGASVAFLSPGLSLEGLTVTNPEGYAADDFLTLGQGSVEVAPASLMGDDVRIPRVRLTGMELDLEQQGGSSNVRAILDHVAQRRSDGGGDGSGDDEGTGAEDGRRVTVETLEIDDTRVTVRAGLAGEQVAVVLRLEDMELRNVGSDIEGGDVTSDVLGLVLEAVVVTILGGVADALPPPLDGDFADTLKGLAPKTALSYEHVEGGTVTVEEVRGDGDLLDDVKGAVEDAVGEMEELF